MVEANTSVKQRRRLGRGLASLMSQPVSIAPPASGSPAPVAREQGPMREPAVETTGSKSRAGGGEQGGRIRSIPVDLIQPNRFQPRKAIDATRLERLAASIRQSGVMQPILVRANKSNSGFEIIAGERRWRSAQLAGLKELPAIECELDDAGAAEWALVENLQREDLDPIERAEAFQMLMSDFGLTHSQIAERVGMDRSSVANTIRLNALDAETKGEVRAGRLSQGHAKALLALPDAALRRTMAQSVVRHGWSVRRLEREVESLISSDHTHLASPRPGRTKPEHITSLEERLSRALRLPARIRQGASRTSGQVILTFANLDEFEAFIRHAER